MQSQHRKALSPTQKSTFCPSHFEMTVLLMLKRTKRKTDRQMEEKWQQKLNNKTE